MRFSRCVCLFLILVATLKAAPDILFIVADDQRPDTIHALANENIRTPHLDRLVAKGTSFTRAYAGYPICYVSRAEMLVCLRDLFPTLCELCEVVIPGTVQGSSLASLLRGKVKRVHDFVTGTFTDTQRMICDDRWKYIRYPKLGREQLFDLQNDPDEMKDLSADPAWQEKKKTLREQLKTWLVQQGDPLEKF